MDSYKYIFQRYDFYFTISTKVKTAKSVVLLSRKKVKQPSSLFSSLANLPKLS